MSLELAIFKDSERRLRCAVVGNDFDELETLLADDLQFVGPDANLSGKFEDIENYRSGKLIVHNYEVLDDSWHHASTEAAVVSVLARLELTYQGQSHTGTYRYARVYGLRDGKAQVVFAQCTPALVD